MKKDNNFGMLTTFIGGTLWGINGVMGSFYSLIKMSLLLGLYHIDWC